MGRALDARWVRERLAGREVVWLDSVGSTMSEASRLAALGSAAIVVAEEQTAGQGRRGRAWHSERGTGLYTSMILRLGLAPAAAPVLTLALGLAAAEAIRTSAGVACDLRWPNDVLVHGRKCAGILVECEGGVFIAGIGINVNQERFPAGIEAISLHQATGLRHRREPLLVELVRAVDGFTGRLLEQGPPAVLSLFERASSYARGKRVTVEGSVEGVTDGLNESGFLYVRRDGGRRDLVLAGAVRPLTPET